MRALFLTADRFEDSELITPRSALARAGIGVDVASLSTRPIRGKRGAVVAVDRTIHEVTAADYDLLVLPGGKAPAQLRTEARVLELVHEFFDAGKPIAAICHGPQILVSAGVLEGRRATCYRSVASELEAAGAQYEDIPVVVDDTLITSRHPGDLPAFVDQLLAALTVTSPSG